jgi:hypothetical protein
LRKGQRRSERQNSTYKGQSIHAGKLLFVQGCFSRFAQGKMRSESFPSESFPSGSFVDTSGAEIHCFGDETPH